MLHGVILVDRRVTVLGQQRLQLRLADIVEVEHIVGQRLPHGVGNDDTVVGVRVVVDGLQEHGHLLHMVVIQVTQTNTCNLLQENLAVGNGFLGDK